MFVSGKTFQPSLAFVDKAGAYLRVERLKGASLGLTPTLSANIRVGWKGLLETKMVNFTKKFPSPPWKNKLECLYHDKRFMSSLIFLGSTLQVDPNGKFLVTSMY